VQYKLVDNILNAGSAAANGTARNGLFRGVNNNYGVNGTGDASNFIGAITYTTKALADTALGSTSADAYDLCVKVKRQLLPGNLTDVEEGEYVFIMNRTTWGKVSTVVDGNGRFKAGSAIDPATGNMVKQIDGNEVLIFPNVANDFVFLLPLKLVEVITYGGIMNLNDGGLVSLKEGLTTYVSRIWADGSIRYGQKYLSGTAATIGTTAVDNQAQNAFRYFRIV
jgi:HK97 family phage major capsid protein